jgi:HK97 family phage prohead protease
MPAGGSRKSREVVEPGAFMRSVNDAKAGKIDVLARAEHESGLHVIARTSNKTLRLREDSSGLWYEADLNDTAFAMDLAKMLRRKDIFESSWAFRNARDHWEHKRDAEPLRRLFDFELIDVAPVSRASYPGTSAKLWESGPTAYMQRRLELAEKSMQ